MSGPYGNPNSPNSHGQGAPLNANITYGTRRVPQDPLTDFSQFDPQASAGTAPASGQHYGATPSPSPSDPLYGGYAQPGGQSYGGFQAGSSGNAGGAGGWGGSRSGSVNWNAFGGLTNLVNQDPAAANVLRAQGLMPTYNGIPVDQMQGQNGGVSVSGAGAGGGGGYNANQPRSSNDIQPGPAPPGYQWETAPLDGQPNRSVLVPDGSQGRGAAPATGGGSGGAPGSGLPLEGQIDSAYGNLIGARGHILNPSQESALVNQGQDTVAHGEQDALQSARLDAIRRGDTSLSSVGSREDAIRAAGSAGQARSAIDTRMGLDQDAGNRMLGALGGAGQQYGRELGNLESLRQLALLQGQIGGPNAGIQAMMQLH